MNLQKVKSHLRIEDNAEDLLIQTYMDAAEKLVLKYLGDDMPDPVPEPVTAAMLLLTADLYENRQRQGTEVFYQNYTYRLLLSPYRSAEVF